MSALQINSALEWGVSPHLSSYFYLCAQSSAFPSVSCRGCATVAPVPVSATLCASVSACLSREHPSTRSTAYSSSKHLISASSVFRRKSSCKISWSYVPCLIGTHRGAASCSHHLKLDSLLYWFVWVHYASLLSIRLASCQRFVPSRVFDGRYNKFPPVKRSKSSLPAFSLDLYRLTALTSFYVVTPLASLVEHLLGRLLEL